MNNERYRERAERMLAAADYDNDDIETDIQDAVADLLHLAAAHDIDVAKLASMAIIHVSVETGALNENDV
jgi:hypothetical protein